MADRKPQPAFQLGDFLRSELDLEFREKLADGSALVRDVQTGDERTLDVQGLMTQELGLPASTPIAYNTVDTALDISPLAGKDRAKLALGNAKGKMKFLKQRFEKVQYDPDQGFVVRDGGVWKQIDPAGLGGGDAWAMTKELVADLADLTDEVAVIAPTAIGASQAGTPGAVAGGAVGGTIRTFLGRAVGTYDATPEEQLFDIGTDAALALGGEAVAAGARVGVKALARAIKNTNKAAAPAAKDAWVGIVGTTTGTGLERASILYDSVDDVAKAMSSLRARTPGGGVAAMKDLATKQQFGRGRDFFQLAQRNLTKQYGEMLDDIVAQPEASGFKANFRELYDDIITGLDDAGVAVLDKGKGGKQILRPLTGEEVTARVIDGKPAELIDAQTFKALKKTVDSLAPFKSAGTLSGPKAIKPLVQFNKILNNARLNLPATTTPNAQRLVGSVSSQFKNSLQKQFDNVGLGDRFTAMQTRYSQFVNDVNLGRKAVQRGERGLETLINQLMSESGRNVAVQNTFENLARLGGKRGQALLQEIRVLEAAKAFSPMLRESGGFLAAGQTIGSVGIGAGLASGSGVAGAAGALGTLSLFSPKAQFVALRSAMRITDFLKGLTPEGRAALLSNPDTIRTLAQLVARSGVESEQAEEALVNQAR